MPVKVVATGVTMILTGFSAWLIWWLAGVACEAITPWFMPKFTIVRILVVAWFVTDIVGDPKAYPLLHPRPEQPHAE